MRLRRKTLRMWLVVPVAAVGIAGAVDETGREIRIADDRPTRGFAAVEALRIDYSLQGMEQLVHTARKQGEGML
jgi:hypothetical protein